MQKINWQEKVEKRKECNKEILKIIDKLSDELPEFRFWQMLWFLFGDLNKDRFYEESYDSLKIIKENIKDLRPEFFEKINELKLKEDD